MYDAGHPTLVLCDNLKGWGGVGSGRDSGWRGHMCACGQFMLMDGKKPSQRGNYPPIKINNFLKNEDKSHPRKWCIPNADQWQRAGQSEGGLQQQASCCPFVHSGRAFHGPSRSQEGGVLSLPLLFLLFSDRFRVLLLERPNHPTISFPKI